MFKNNKKIIIGNWKMNQSLAETREFFSSFAAKEDIFYGVCPQGPYLSNVISLSSHLNNFSVGLQNISEHINGAFTGETSIQTALDLNATFTLVGHSERRQFFGESPEKMIKKIELAMEKNIGVVYCLGENLQEREAGEVKEVLENQVNEVLPLVKNLNSDLLCLAYEPVWAIGTGKTASAGQCR